MAAPPAELSARLTDKNSHVLQFWNELTEEQQTKLKQQVEEVDVKECDEAFTSSASLSTPSPSDLSALPSDHHIVKGELRPGDVRRIKLNGFEAIAKGELAVLVMAGGQATRLGSDVPKGMVKLGVNATDDDTLLGMQAAKIRRLQTLANEHHPKTSYLIQWLVMTSAGTEEATREHLNELIHKGLLTQSQVHVFSQENIPAFDMDGRFLLATKDSIATSPNGNGGVYSALAPLLPLLEEKGVKYLHVYCVDNILVKVGDPFMLGLAMEKGADCMAKAVARVEAEEKVGVICLNKGRPGVVEYSELGDLAAKRVADGKLEYRAGNIANHLFSLAFLKSFCTPTFRLPYHRAHKKIAYVDEKGETIKPADPNGIKLEQFVFDVFEKSNNFFILEVAREEEFSPLKNPDSVGKECLSTCRRDLRALHTSWLRELGVKLDGESSEVVIKPSRSYDGEALEEFVGAKLVDIHIVH